MHTIYNLAIVKWKPVSSIDKPIFSLNLPNKDLSFIFMRYISKNKTHKYTK